MSFLPDSQQAPLPATNTETVTPDNNSLEVKSYPLSAKEQFFLTWGLESLKGTVPALNDTLQRIILLDTALIGGGFVVVKEGVLPHWWAIITLLLLISSLTAALWGIFPRGRSVNLLDPEDIQANEYGAINRKTRMLRVSFIALVIALLIAVLSLVGRDAPGTATPSNTPSNPTATH